MKLSIIPLREITSQKVFLYGAATKIPNEIKASIPDKIVNKATSMWTSWESAEKGWKKKVVEWGNKAVSRIDYREHSLKSVMSLAAYRRYYPDSPDAKIALSHPTKLSQDFILSEIRALAKEGVPRHRQKLIYSFILMPFTAPFMLVPVVPNLPFFYVAFRAWSHYRAMQGSSHLQLLLEQNRINLTPSQLLDEMYDKDGKLNNTKMMKVLHERMPEMAVEVERAGSQLDRLESSTRPEQISEDEIKANERRARTGLHK